MTDYAFILEKTHPGKEWTLDGDSYEGLVWLSDGDKPSKTALDAAWESHVAEQEATEYRRVRAPEYPPIGDQLDALYHAGVFPEDMAAQIAAVKEKYPKPEEA